MNFSVALLLSVLLAGPVAAGVEFDSASSEHYHAAQDLFGGVAYTGEFTIVHWFNPNADDNQTQCPIGVGDGTSTSAHISFAPQIRYADSPIRLRFTVGNTSAYLTADPKFGEWNSWAGIRLEGGATDTLINVLNGDWAGRATASVTTDDLIVNEIAVGAQVQDVQGKFFDGKVAYAAIFGWAFTEADVAAFHAKKHPLMFSPRPVFFMALDGHKAVPQDRISGTAYTVNGTPVSSESPLIRRPGPRYSQAPVPQLLREWRPDNCYRRDGYHVAAA